MGRWAQARKRGSSPRSYLLPAPGPGDFTLTQPGGPGLTTFANQIAAFPPPSDWWVIQFTVNGGAPLTHSENTSAYSVGLYAPGTILTAKFRWSNVAGDYLSGWSPIQFYTTT